MESDEGSGSGPASAPKPDPSVSPEKMVKLFEAVLKLPGWAGGKAADQFLRVGNRSIDQQERGVWFWA